jgi:hypothetical protein
MYMGGGEFFFCLVLLGAVFLAATELLLSLGPPVIVKSAGLGLRNMFHGIDVWTRWSNWLVGLSMVFVLRVMKAA